MAQLILTIPDALVPRVRAGLARPIHYSQTPPPSPEAPVALPTVAQMEAFLLAYVKRTVRQSETEDALATVGDIPLDVGSPP